MRLALINQFYTPDISPTAHLCASLAEHRAAMGDQVTVIAGRGGYVRSMAKAKDDTVNVIRVWTAQLGSTSIFRRLLDWLTFYILATMRVLMLPRQDVIVAMTTPPCIAWAGALQKMLHPTTRLLLWNMDSYPEAVERTGIIRPGGWVSRVMRALNRALFRRLDYLVCLDSAMAELLMSQYAPRDRSLPVAIIPNWERAAFFPPGASPALPEAGWMESLRGKFVVLYLGNAGFGHEFQTTLDVAEKLRDELVVFLFVGGGALRPSIEQQCERLQLRNMIFHDYVSKEQTPGVMATADCALITLENYAAGVMSPSKLHSNLAMRLPILYIGPAGSNVDEAIARFNCGISCRPRSADAVADFLRSLRRDRPLHELFRRQARRAFDEAYSDTAALPQFDEIFRALSGGEVPRRPDGSPAVAGAAR
jgi:colanic acid biosynthesis glycosyl transferase WcaI